MSRTRAKPIVYGNNSPVPMIAVAYTYADGSTILRRISFASTGEVFVYAASNFDRKIRA